MEELKKHFLYPAGIFTSSSTVLVSTILGTCVAVCLYDPVNKIGGINHFIMPVWDGKSLPSSKFGDHANRQLLEKMLTKGAKKSSIQAKIFGGSCRKGGADLFQIGAKNIAVAENWLAQMQIPLMARSTGGRSPRKLIFNTAAGTVDMKFLLPEIADNMQIK